MRMFFFRTLVVTAIGSTLFLSQQHARAVGWDRDDFLISGAPNFPDRIGVFDHDFTFKGYLEQNFLGVSGIDFDAQGRLVAQSLLNPEVRIYEPNGVRAGGFTQSNSPMLVAGSDVEVGPDGNFVLGTLSNGARVFTPQGVFVRQYGDGNSTGVAILPGHRLWVGGAGTTVRIFDTDTGAQVGTFTADQQVNSGNMQYIPTRNAVLLVDPDRDAGGVYERDLGGALLQQFHLPIAQTNCNGATYGPNGDIFGTSNNLAIDVVRWRPDGTVAGTFDVYPNNITPVRILWAGLVPEPAALTVLIACLSVVVVRPSRRREPLHLCEGCTFTTENVVDRSAWSDHTDIPFQGRIVSP